MIKPFAVHLVRPDSLVSPPVAPPEPQTIHGHLPDILTQFLEETETEALTSKIQVRPPKGKEEEEKKTIAPWQCSPRKSLSSVCKEGDGRNQPNQIRSISQYHVLS